MLSPSQRYINWFKSLAVDQRTDVTYLVGGHLPGTSIDLINITSNSSETEADHFVKWIEQESAASAFKNASVAASLVAVTELMIIRKRGGAEGWANTKARLEDLAQQHNSDTFAKSAAQMEFRGRQWIVACDNWKMLRAGALSDHLIEDWMDQNSLQGT